MLLIVLLMAVNLGIAYQRTKSASVYYTLEATVHTNFPGARSISTVARDEYTLFIIGACRMGDADEPVVAFLLFFLRLY